MINFKKEMRQLSLKNDQVENSPICNLKFSSIEGNQKYEKAIEMNKNFYEIMRLNGNTEQEKAAGMQIFATVIFNAWRKRRDEIKLLKEEIDILKKASIKAKNQIQVFSSMLNFERKQNNEIKSRLNSIIKDQKNENNSYEILNRSHVQLTCKYEKLQSQIHSKEQVIEGLEILLSETKAELFKSMANERKLENKLAMEQRKVQELENGKNEILNELFEIKSELIIKKLRFEDLNAKTSEQVDLLYERLSDIKMKISRFEEKESLNQGLVKINTNQKKQINELFMELNHLKDQKQSMNFKSLSELFFGRSFIMYGIFKIFHLLSLYLMPSIPPPLKVDLTHLGILDKMKLV